MRVAVIGLGRMGRFYAEALASLAPAVEIVGLVDPDAATRQRVAAALGGAPSFADPAHVLARDDLEAVVVATTTASHAGVVMAAARAGKAVFCEKPLALTVDETRRVLAVVDAAGVMLQIGFMRRFDAAYQRAKAAIDAGQIGRPLTIKSVGRDPTCPPPGYAAPAHSGGLIIDMGVHDFDLARWLMSGEVERVSAEGSALLCDEVRQVGDIDNAVINLRFASGALGNVEVSRTGYYGYDIRTEVLGSQGAVRVGATSAEDVQLLTEQTALDPSVPPFIRRFGAAYRAQIQAFVECVREHRPPAVGGADALAAIEIAVAATESARSGRPVALSEFKGQREVSV